MSSSGGPGHYGTAAGTPAPHSSPPGADPAAHWAREALAGRAVHCLSPPLPAVPATGSGGRLSAARCMHRAGDSGLAHVRRRGRAVGPPERAGQQHTPWASAPSQTSSLAASGAEKLIAQQGSRAASVRRRRRLLHANFALQLAWAASAVLQSQAASPSCTNASPTVVPPSEEATAAPAPLCDAWAARFTAVLPRG